MNRRTYLKSTGLLLSSYLLPSFTSSGSGKIITVTGPIPAEKLGTSLIHEHVLVDFGGAENYDPNKWNHEKVIEKMLPYLKELKSAGCETLFECTPAFLGRDVLLLKKLSKLSGIRMITNTGFYGAVDNKFFPAFARVLTPEKIADIWIKEFENGIDGADIKPGFMKISVDSGALSELHKKLVKAAALTHLKTGLTIASHTGPALPAFQEIELLKESGVHPSAFVWVHAQSEPDKSKYIKAANEGAWISLDGLSDDNVQEYSAMISNLKNAGLLSKVLVSHDAGYYDPGKEDGGPIRRYTTLFDKLVPELKKSGFSRGNLDQLLRRNPAEAFTIRIRRI